MKALTLIRPWSTLIALGHKPIENRTWKPSPAQLRDGEDLAIHAGKKWDEEVADFALSLGVEISPKDDDHPHSAIICVVNYMGTVGASSNPWFFGPWGWVLRDIRPLTPIPCKGAQGLWTPPADVLAAIEEQLR
jgi:hypothetical protein